MAKLQIKFHTAIPSQALRKTFFDRRTLGRVFLFSTEGQKDILFSHHKAMLYRARTIRLHSKNDTFTLKERYVYRARINLKSQLKKCASPLCIMNYELCIKHYAFCLKICSWHCSMSHLGVLVAPHMPTERASTSHSRLISSGPSI